VDVGFNSARSAAGESSSKMTTGVHAGEGGDDLRPLFSAGWADPRPCAPDRSVGVDPTVEPATLAPRSLEIPDVAGVEQVERPVGEDDPPARRALASGRFEQLCPRQILEAVIES